jgi:hypothetical protein
MIEHFERQLKTAVAYTREDAETYLALADPKGLNYQETVNRVFNRVGSQPLYFIVKSPNKSSDDKGIMIKCYYNELEKYYADCLEYIEMFNEDFPVFKIIDIDLYQKVRSGRNQVVDKKEEKSNLVLEAVAYKVKQTYNTHTYFIKLFNLSGYGRWYVLCGTETFPETFNMYADFQNGFETVEDAKVQLEIYLKSTSK